MSPLIAQMNVVRFASPVKVAVGTILMQDPHWTAADASKILDGPDGSRRPAAFTAGATGTAVAEVEITGAGGGTGILSADLGGLHLEGPLQLADGVQTVNLQVLGLGPAIARHAGDASWQIAVSSSPPIAVRNVTRLEVFVILATPAVFFQTTGVWAEALRLLVPKVVGGLGSPQAVVHSITDFCHSGLGMVYDSLGSRQAFNVTAQGGRFSLTNLLNNSRKTEVNCFDLSASVRVLSGALGVTLDWLIHPDFGFLRKTDLIGVGCCNNPFFLLTGTQPVLTPNDPKRLPFLQHAFGERDSVVFDACAGPHRGTESPQVYLNNAVDNVTPMGSPPPKAAAILAAAGEPISGLK